MGQEIKSHSNISTKLRLTAQFGTLLKSPPKQGPEPKLLPIIRQDPKSQTEKGRAEQSQRPSRGRVDMGAWAGVRALYQAGDKFMTQDGARIKVVAQDGSWRCDHCQRWGWRHDRGPRWPLISTHSLNRSQTCSHSLKWDQNQNRSPARSQS